MDLEICEFLRHIHPNFIVNGVVTRQAFEAQKREDLQLSGYDGRRISAEESFHHYTQQGRKSACVCGLSSADCAEVGLRIELSPNEVNEFHVHIDFNGHGSPRALSTHLRNAAISRGILYQPSHIEE